MVKVDVFESRNLPVAEMPFEIVERKGLGHPDYICDAIMERVSIELCKEYLKRFGTILHHNIDKGLLSAGHVKKHFGGGQVLEPMLLVFGDRAISKTENETIPVEEIAVNSAKQWLKENFRFIDPDKHLKYQVEIKQGSQALVDIFSRKSQLLGANDTSAAVGYAPLTETEKLVLSLEQYLNSKPFKLAFPETGEDVKIMAVRRGNRVNLTIAMPLVASYIESEKEYFRRKREVLGEINNYLEGNSGLEFEISFNTLDLEGRGEAGTYLTLLGTSAEDADSGEVGRGNRVNGLIPLQRPVSNEAAAGKNPVSHVGKIYNVLTHKLASEVYRSVNGVKEVYVWLVSEIGRPINEPKLADVYLSVNKGVNFNEAKKEAEERVMQSLETNKMKKFIKDLSGGKIRVY